MLRRDAHHLQVGCHPGVVIPDRPGLYAFLRQLNGVRDLSALRRQRRRHFPDLTGDLDAVLRPLLASGAVIDRDATTATPVRPTARPTVRLHYDVAAMPLAAIVCHVLSDLDIAVGPEPDLTVVMSGGEPRRATLAEMVRSNLPHLIVTLDGPCVRIGPWVVPGQTPCTECLDLNRAAWDPAWSALVPQFGSPLRDSAVPPAVQLAGAAVLTDELARFAAGARPLTWSSVHQVGPGLNLRTVGDSAFHPRCGCSVLLAA